MTAVKWTIVNQYGTHMPVCAYKVRNETDRPGANLM